MARQPKKNDEEGVKPIARNKRAFHDYHVLDTLECGIVLTGTEVKSLRERSASLEDAYAKIDNGEVWLLGSDIPEYSMGNRMNHKPKRPRKLLLHRREINKFAGKATQRGFTLVPLKMYFKEGRALRTETTINDTRDFAIGKRLHNLPALREVGFGANRRLLDVQTISQDCAVGEEVFRQLTQPCEVDGQRASALRYGDATVLALLSALLVFRLLPRGFCNHELREHLAPLLGEDPSALTQGRMTYQLRRLRLHGLIVRQAGTHRYGVTDHGLRIALFFTRSYARVLRPGLSQVTAGELPDDPPLRRAFAQLECAMDHYVAQAKLTSES